MSDLIRREEAREAIEKLMEIHFDRKVVLAKARDAIVSLPSAEPKTGKWKQISPARIYQCSNCGQNVMTNDIDVYKFCHACGADMRGESHE